MHDPQDRWEDETYDNDGGSGLLWQTARNVGILIVGCLLVAGVLSLGDSAPSAPQQSSQTPRPDRDEQSYTVRTGASGDELIIPAGRNGHFLATAEVEGVEMRFLVDTGASRVVLSTADAARLGFRLEDLEFTERYQTANGEVRGAPVVLSDLRIGDLEVEDVAASVIRTPLTTSLLGMSFLSRLEGYEVRSEGLVLRW